MTRLDPKKLLLLVILAWGCLAGQALAQSKPSGPAASPSALFIPATLPSDASSRSAAATTDAQVVRSRPVYINPGLIAPIDPAGPAVADVGQTITLNLFDDLDLTAVATSVTQTTRGVTWIGRLEGIPDGQVVLVISNGVLSANISTPDGKYQLRYLQGNMYQVQKIDSSLFPPDHPPEAKPLSPPASMLDKPADFMAADDGSFIDVMVLYTSAARAAAGSTAAMQSLVDLAIAETNTSYLNSGIVQRVRLVHTEEVGYSEAARTSPDVFTAALNCVTQTADGCLDGIHATRNTYGADLVSMWIEDSSSCGLGYLQSTASTAFSVVARTCATGYYSFAHEMGHNMGAHHDVYVAPTQQPYAYGHGFTKPTVASPWRTIMAYNDACAAVGKNCTRVQFWSNPAVLYAGLAMGDAATADNHRVLNERSLTVANFRNSVTGTPCTYALGTTTASVTSATSTGSVGVTTTAGCAWTATSNATWLTVTSGASGTGNGSVGYAVAANTSTSTRSGSITIAGQTFNVTQAAASACSYALSSSSASFTAAATNTNVNVITTAGCAWSASSNASWISITSGASGSGNGSVGYAVAANNTTQPRSSSITAAGLAHTVSQSGGLTSPGAPTQLAAAVAPGRVAISFTAPNDNGGSPITGYTASCAAAGLATKTGTGTASPVTVGGLVGGKRYSCTVTARNAIGQGTPSAVLLVDATGKSFDISTLMLLLLDD